MPDLVSILIPAYKAERLIGETLRSAQNQTWPRKEIIVVDDGSPDRTYHVARKYESGSVKVVRQENGGAPSARNKAFSLAQGDYIQWLDADDVLHPDKISIQLDGADRGSDSLTLRTSAWGQFFFDTARSRFSRDSLWQDLSPIDWILTKFNDNVWMNPAVWLVSRKLTEMSGPWDNRLALSGDDDGEYICRVVGNADRVRFSEGAVCYYRIGTVGSLNWNMETKEESLESIALSMRLSVQHLLKLEDSERTRDASSRYLQTFLQYFYGYDDSFFLEIKGFARKRLNRELEPPRASWKYRPLEALAGKRFTRKTLTSWRNYKTLIRSRYEHAICQSRRVQEMKDDEQQIRV